MLRRWAGHLAVGCPRPSPLFVVGLCTSAVGCPTSVCTSVRRRGVVCFEVGLPMLLWAAIPRSLLLFVVVAWRTSVLDCPHCCGLPYFGVCLPSSPWGCVLRCWAALPQGSPLVVVVMWLEPRCWASHVVVECPAVVFPPRRCVMWDLRAVMGLAESGGWRC